MHEKFKDGQNAYQWEDCFRFMNTEHDRLVSNSSFGSIIFASFLKIEQKVCFQTTIQQMVMA